MSGSVHQGRYREAEQYKDESLNKAFVAKTHANCLLKDTVFPPKLMSATLDLEGVTFFLKALFHAQALLVLAVLFIPMMTAACVLKMMAAIWLQVSSSLKTKLDKYIYFMIRVSLTL